MTVLWLRFMAAVLLCCSLVADMLSR